MRNSRQGEFSGIPHQREHSVHLSRFLITIQWNLGRERNQSRGSTNRSASTSESVRLLSTSRLIRFFDIVATQRRGLVCGIRSHDSGGVVEAWTTRKRWVMFKPKRKSSFTSEVDCGLRRREDAGVEKTALHLDYGSLRICAVSVSFPTYVCLRFSLLWIRFGPKAQT